MKKIYLYKGENFGETYMYTGKLTLEMLEEFIKDLEINCERTTFPMSKPAYDALDAAMKIEFEKLHKNGQRTKPRNGRKTRRSKGTYL